MTNAEISRLLRLQGYIIPERSIALWDRKYDRAGVVRWLKYIQTDRRGHPSRRPFILERYQWVRPSTVRKLDTKK